MVRLVTNKIFRIGFASSLCLALLTGCSWLNDWPAGESDEARAPVPHERVVKTDHATWLEPVGNPVAPVFKEARPTPIDGDTAARLAILEQSLAEIRNDINTMMPALTRLASIQTDLHHSLVNIQPAAGRGAATETINTVSAPVQLAPPAPSVATASSYAALEPAAGAAIPAPALARSQAPEPTYEDGMLVEAWVPDRSKRKREKAEKKRLAQDANAYNASVRSGRAAPRPATVQQAAAPAPVSAPRVRQTVIADVPMPIASARAQPVSYSGQDFVSNIRFGEHPDKTRIVLDVSNDVAFRYDLDSAENLLLVELPGTAWNSSLQRSLSHAGIVASYQALADGKGGTQLVIQLRQPARVSWAQSLKASSTKGPRIVLDVAGL